MELELIISVVFPLVSCGVIFGICKNKIEQNEKEIAELKKLHESDVRNIIEKQNDSDELLQEINKQLIELNTKMSLLLKGKINMEDK